MDDPQRQLRSPIGKARHILDMYHSGAAFGNVYYNRAIEKSIAKLPIKSNGVSNEFCPRQALALTSTSGEKKPNLQQAADARSGFTKGLVYVYSIYGYTLNNHIRVPL